MGPFTGRHVAFLAAVLIGTALVLVSLTLPLSQPTAAAPTAQTGTAFFRIGAETEGLQIGQRLPDFTGSNDGQTVQLTDIDGKPIRLADLAGHPLWINFWATWCPPCRQETPDLRDAYSAHASSGLVLLAIDVQEPREVVADYVKTYGLTYRIGLDTTAAIMRAYAVFGLPTHYFVSADGIIRDRYYGPLSRAQIETILAKILPP